MEECCKLGVVFPLGNRSGSLMIRLGVGVKRDVLPLVVRQVKFSLDPGVVYLGWYPRYLLMDLSLLLSQQKEFCDILPTVRRSNKR